MHSVGRGADRGPRGVRCVSSWGPGRKSLRGTSFCNGRRGCPSDPRPRARCGPGHPSGAGRSQMGLRPASGRLPPPHSSCFFRAEPTGRGGAGGRRGWTGRLSDSVGSGGHRVLVWFLAWGAVSEGGGGRRVRALAELWSEGIALGLGGGGEPVEGVAWDGPSRSPGAGRLREGQSLRGRRGPTM